MKLARITIIGAGAVGTTVAYTLAQRNIPAEIALLDINEARCRGEILDLNDALPFCKTSTVIQGDWHGASQSDIIIIAAGARQEIDQKRSDLLGTNKKIIGEILKKINLLKTNALIIMVTNPVDVLTHYALVQTGLSPHRVFGSGTILDSMRLRGLIAHHLSISPRSMNVYILGEHGESQFPVWSLSTIAGIPILEYPQLNHKILNEFFLQARDQVYKIIKCKGSTYYGVASCVASMCENILFDQKAIVPLSCYIPEYKICLSVPCVLGKDGIEQYIPLTLAKEEQKLLENAATIIKAQES